MYQRLLREAHCLGSDNELLSDKLRHAFDEGRIEMGLLSTAIGGKQLDDKFMEIKLV